MWHFNFWLILETKQNKSRKQNQSWKTKTKLENKTNLKNIIKLQNKTRKQNKARKCSSLASICPILLSAEMVVLVYLIYFRVTICIANLKRELGSYFSSWALERKRISLIFQSILSEIGPNTFSVISKSFSGEQSRKTLEEQSRPKMQWMNKRKQYDLLIT